MRAMTNGGSKTVNTIDLTSDPKRVERLDSIFRNKHRDRGDWVIYAEGDYSNGIGLTPIGIKAMELQQEGLAMLVQKRISDEPRRYIYVAVML